MKDRHTSKSLPDEAVILRGMDEDTIDMCEGQYVVSHFLFSLEMVGYL